MPSIGAPYNRRSGAVETKQRLDAQPRWKLIESKGHLAGSSAIKRDGQWPRSDLVSDVVHSSTFAAVRRRPQVVLPSVGGRLRTYADARPWD